MNEEIVFADEEAVESYEIELIETGEIIVTLEPVEKAERITITKMVDDIPDLFTIYQLSKI